MWPPITVCGTPTSDYWNTRRKNVVYRLYSAGGELLYIGMSSNICNRLYEHRRTTPWFADVARARFTLHPSRGAALAAEREAIESERPLHNRQYAAA